MIDTNLLKNKIVVICGPTACGKSKFAIDLAHKIAGVIINADSMQVYKEIPILTAQPPKDSISFTEHKLYGFKSCREYFSVGNWLEIVTKEIKNCFATNKIPILVGGTGMYMYSLMNGISKIPPISREVKEKVSKLIKSTNTEKIHDLLLDCDPVLANQLESNDRQRIIRALEVYYQTQKPLSDWQKNKTVFFHQDKFFVIYIKPERTLLYNNINCRFIKMIESGAIKEVEKLLTYNTEQHKLPKALGLEQLISYIKEKITLESAIEKSQQLTRNYAKRQITWFNNKIKTDYLINKLELYLN